MGASNVPQSSCSSQSPAASEKNLEKGTVQRKTPLLPPISNQEVHKGEGESNSAGEEGGREKVKRRREGSFQVACRLEGGGWMCPGWWWRKNKQEDKLAEGREDKHIP